MDKLVRLIEIPLAKSIIEKAGLYIVKKKDTYWDIAKKFPGVSAQNIMDLNGMKSGAKIYPGMKLKIKKSN